MSEMTQPLGTAANPDASVADPRFPQPPAVVPHTTLDPRKVGMIAFLASEVAFFSTLIVAYLIFMGRDTSGPKPGDVLSLPLVLLTTACLLGSSYTIHLAEAALRAGSRQRFAALWGATAGLGIIFLAGTAYEWYEMIVHKGFTIRSNLFGTTFYTLVGFHAFHVTAGVVLLLIVLGLHRERKVSAKHHLTAELVAWYWHFVDVVWVVVFIVVYLVSRWA